MSNLNFIAFKGDIGQQYVNPFKDKNVYPFNQIGRVLVDRGGNIIHELNEYDSRFDSNGNEIKNIDDYDIMVKIPCFYAKRTWNGDKVTDSILTEVPLSVDKGAYRVMDAFLREDGTFDPYILVAVTKASLVNNEIRSVAGQKPLVNKNIDQFKQLADAKGLGWGINDMNTYTMLQCLYKVAFADTDSQEYVGLGWTNKNESATTGGTLSLGNRSGYGNTDWAIKQGFDAPDNRICGIMGMQDGRFKYWFKDPAIMPTGILGAINQNDNGIITSESGNLAIKINENDVYIGAGYNSGTAGKPVINGTMPTGKLSLTCSYTTATHTILMKNTQGSVTVQPVIAGGKIAFDGNEGLTMVIIYEGALTDVEKNAELAKNLSIPTNPINAPIPNKEGVDCGQYGNYTNLATDFPLIRQSYYQIQDSTGTYLNKIGNDDVITGDKVQILSGKVRVKGITTPYKLRIVKDFPFTGDTLPDRRISGYIGADAKGLKVWFNEAGAKIKGIENARVVEETDDYMIICDGIVTTIENYVTGTYDLYKERLASVEKTKDYKNIPLVAPSVNVEIDHVALLNKINNEQLSAIATPLKKARKKMSSFVTNTKHSYLFKENWKHIKINEEIQIHYEDNGTPIENFELTTPNTDLVRIDGHTVTGLKAGTAVISTSVASFCLIVDEEAIPPKNYPYGHLEPRVVPIPVDLCCRVDKKTGEIYIGEGYENLWDGKLYTLENTEVEPGIWIRTKTKGRVFSFNNQAGVDDYVTVIAKFNNGQKLVLPNACELISITEYTDGYTCISYKELGLATHKFQTDKDVDINERYSIKGAQITKTSTLKPYVKTQMPSGKMSILSSVTESTHTFLPKNAVNAIAPVKDGLICWLDGRDGKGQETTWIDRSGNGNNATLTNFNFTADSGWTGKSLKFDGINDIATIPFNDLSLTVELRVILKPSSFEGFFGSNRFEHAGKDEGNVSFIENKLKTFYWNGGYLNIDNVVRKEGDIVSIYMHNTNTYINGVKSNFDKRIFWGYIMTIATYCSVRVYNKVLTDTEIQQNYEYEQSIDRTVAITYPMIPEVESYGIGLSNQLTKEQLKTFRLSNDKTKFVAGLNYCEGLIVDKYTYSKTLEIMETEDWKSEKIVEVK